MENQQIGLRVATASRPERGGVMKRTILAILLIAVMLVGCTTTPATTDSTEVVTDDETYSDITYVEDSGIPEIPEGFGLYGSTVEFDGVFPGWSGTVPLTIVNGQDRARLFVVSIKSPTKPREGYEALPEEYFYWITISEPEVFVPAGMTHQIPITLAMPQDSDYTGKRAEVRILIEDTTQTGLVQIALETKWFIITAD